PGTDVGLLAPAEHAQPVQRLAGGDLDQVGALVMHDVEVDARPPQPGLLQDVLRVGGRAEYLVGDGEEQVAVGEERLGGGVRAAAVAPAPAAVFWLGPRHAGHGWAPVHSRLCLPTRHRAPRSCDTEAAATCLRRTSCGARHVAGAVTRTGSPASRVRSVQ